NSLNDFKNLSEPDWLGDGYSYTGYNTIGEQPLKPNSKTQYKNILIGDDIVFNDKWSALVGFNYATVIQTNYSDGEESSK
ncbi:hypothetical protein ACNO6Z_12745, partial [Aliarcobacter lanthieri]|uniref:hypothetical protein n=1 Tax=Aliarcobacter lanthieri TaxID=1355374 RepID=UPI003AA85B32